MPPETGQSSRSGEQVARPRRDVRSAQEYGPLGSDLSALQEHGGERPTRPPGRRTGVSWLLGLTAAVLVGAAVGLIGKFEYVCGATLEVESADRENAVRVGPIDAGASAVASVRQSFWDHARGRLGPAMGRGDSLSGWSVEQAGPSRIRLLLRTTNRELGVEQARSVADEFLAAMAALREASLQTPTSGERALSASVEQMARRLDEAESEIDKVMKSLPDEDPSETRQALFARWQPLRERYEGLRADLLSADQELARLRRSPVPSIALPEAEERRAAHAADKSLQQDLQELEVNLAELRKELREVSRDCSPKLATLEEQGSELGSAATVYRERTGDLLDAAKVSTLLEAIREYGQTLANFSGRWRNHWNQVENASSDPLAADLVQIQESLASLARAFLYDGGRELTAVRAAIRAAGESVPDVARVHVVQSDLLRSFRGLESTHHQLEFCLQRLDARDNFHLDAALRAAKGLHRRSEQRVARIEKQLEQEALERARRERLNAIAAAEHRLETVRATLDQVVQELLGLQATLIDTSGRSESFLRDKLEAQFLEREADATRADIDALSEQLNRLQEERLAAETRLSVVQCGVLEGPIDLPRRLRVGGLAGGLTLIIVLMGQWLLPKR